MSAHLVAALGFDGMAPFELGVVTEVFALPRPELEVDWWYSFALCAERPGRLSAVGGFGIDAPHGLELLARADTIVVPGTADVRRDPPAAVLAALRAAHARGARLMSICSGAFVLAAAGLLDGRRAATHWRYAALMRERFPAVDVDEHVLYLDDGDLITAAGTAAGIDACLHVVRTDHGAGIAARVARRMVVAAHRDGGQAQFIEQPVRPLDRTDPIGALMASVRSRLHEPHDVAALAAAVHLSPRQFTRRFRALTGTSPGRWLIDQRVEASLHLLEQDPRGVEDIGAAVGFGSPAAYRHHFRAVMGVGPAAWRRRFGTVAPAARAPRRAVHAAAVSDPGRR